MINRLQIGVVCLILFMVLTTAIATTLNGYHSFYQAEEAAPPALKIARKINTFTPLAIFESYTGFNTGYGFFAPNVASSFVFIHSIYNSKGKLETIKQGIDFNSKEGLVRFSTLQSLFLDKLNQNNSDLYNTYLDIIAQQIAKHVLEHYPPGYRIETQIYLYDYPRLQNLSTTRSTPSPQLIPIKCYNLSNPS